MNGKHVFGSLLGKSCQRALILAKQPQELQRQAFLFGKHLSLAWQASMDLEPFTSSRLLADAKISLISAPILFHLEHDPTIFKEIKKGKTSVEDIDFNICNSQQNIALNELRKFPTADARTVLQNIILANREK